MSKNILVRIALCAALASPLVGCKSDSDSMNMPAADSASLYTRLGGEKAITAVVDDFIPRAVADPKVNFFRKGVEGYPEWKPSPEEVAVFRKHLIQFVEVASGGPQKYEGKSMKESHAGMKISQSEFNALAGDLSASLDKFNVPAKEKNELLTAVAGTAKDMVEVPS